MAGLAKPNAVTLQTLLGLSDKILERKLLEAVRRSGVKFRSPAIFKQRGWKNGPEPMYDRFWKRTEKGIVESADPLVWDVRCPLLEEEALSCGAILLWRRLYKYGVRWVGGIETAAIPIVAAILTVNKAVGAPPIYGFYLRKRRKPDGLRRLLEGARPAPGSRVALVDDIVNKGVSKRRLFDYCESRGFKVAALLVIVDGERGGREIFERVCPVEAIFTKRAVLGRTNAPHETAPKALQLLNAAVVKRDTQPASGNQSGSPKIRVPERQLEQRSPHGLKPHVPHLAEAMDTVWMLGKGSTAGDWELRYSMRSFWTNYRGTGKPWLIGHIPKWLDARTVHVLPWPDPYRKCKDANLLHKAIRLAFEPQLSDSFILCSDDHILLRPSCSADFKYWYKGEIGNEITEEMNRWQVRLVNTGRLLRRAGFQSLNFDCHIPYPLRKKWLKEALRFNFAEDPGMCVFSTILNSGRVSAENLDSQRVRGWLGDKNMPANVIDAKLAKNQFACLNDLSLDDPYIVSRIEKMFPEPAPWELDAERWGGRLQTSLGHRGRFDVRDYIKFVSCEYGGRGNAIATVGNWKTRQQVKPRD